MNGNKEYKKIPMGRPGIDHWLSGIYTYDKESYDKCIKSEEIQQKLKDGTLQLYLNANGSDGTYIEETKPAGVITSIDLENNTCDIKLSDTVSGIVAQEILDNPSSIFVYVGVNSTGDVIEDTKRDKVFKPMRIDSFMLVAEWKSSEFYKKNLADYPVEGTYLDKKRTLHNMIKRIKNKVNQLNDLLIMIRFIIA